MLRVLSHLEEGAIMVRLVTIVDMVEPVFQIGSEVHLDRKMR